MEAQRNTEGLLTHAHYLYQYKTTERLTILYMLIIGTLDKGKGIKQANIVKYIKGPQAPASYHRTIYDAIKRLTSEGLVYKKIKGGHVFLTLSGKEYINQINEDLKQHLKKSALFPIK